MTHQARPSRPAKYAAITTQSSVAMVSLPSGCGLRLALAPVEEEGEKTGDPEPHRRRPEPDRRPVVHDGLAGLPRVAVHHRARDPGPDQHPDPVGDERDEALGARLARLGGG